MTQYDVVIVGGGVVGATAALLLAKNTALRIALLDAQPLPDAWRPERIDHRVSAISPASQRIFQNIGVWDSILAKRVSPYGRMHVWEEKGSGHIAFNCADIGARVLGYIVEDKVMRNSLQEAFAEHANLHVLHPIQLLSLQDARECVQLTTEDKQIFTTQLLIGADGANSWVRSHAGIQLKTWDYQQTALVATVKTEVAHLATARQRFLRTGPLAFLPLQEPHTSSIVWSTSPAHATELLALDEDGFRQSLTQAFASELGNVTQVSERYSFPLTMRHAKNYVKSRIAIIGDAAHTIHPLAGQGMNLGLLDAACLVNVIIAAVNKKREFASFATLRRYERWRKSDNLAMLAAVEGLKYLFLSEKKSVATMRSLGLSFVDQAPLLKNFLANYALGRRREA